MAHMRRVAFYVEPELMEGLKRLKARDGVPAAESIRRAIAAYLTQKGVTTKTARRRSKR